MKIIRSTPNESGAYPPIQSWNGDTPPDGYSQIANDCDTSAMQTHAGFVTRTVENDVVTAITGNDAAHQAYLSSLPQPDLDAAKSSRIAESKTMLAAYLAAHPLTWTDGKQYSVTEDKQALLTGNIAAYQLAVTLGQTAELTWNATGEECTVWAFNDLAALAIAIKAYVKPLVAYQQAAEVAINACATVEAAAEVPLDYGSVGNA